MNGSLKNTSRSRTAKNRAQARPPWSWIMTSAKPCPECGQKNIYAITTVSGSAHGPHLLPGLGGFLHLAMFEVRVCADCGLTQFFASPEARGKLASAKYWRRL